MKVAIVGAGAIGRATAAYVAHHGHTAALWSPSGRSTSGLLKDAPAGNNGRGRLTYTGALEGAVDVDIIKEPREFAAADVVVITLPGDAYPEILPLILPHLHAVQSSYGNLLNAMGRPRHGILGWLRTALRKLGLDV